MSDAREGTWIAHPRAGVFATGLLVLVASFLVAPGQGCLVGDVVGAETDEDPYSALLDAAFVEYEAHRYQAALELFEDAAEVRRTGEVLFNIAACHEYLGDLEEAVQALQEAIDLGISAALQDRAQRKIEALNQRLESKTPDSGAGQAEQGSAHELTGADDGWAKKRRTLGGLGAGLLGGGGAAVAAGGVLWGLAWNENVQFEAADDLETKQGHIDAVGEFALAGDITAGVGAAVAVSGLVISLVGYRCEAPGARRAEVALHPVVLPLPDGGFALVVGGEF